MNEHFIALLKEQLELESRLDDLYRRIGAALKAERDRGNQARLLVSHEGQVYSLERPGEQPMPGKMWHFRFRREGTLL
jgi:hypothetical protein